MRTPGSAIVLFAIIMPLFSSAAHCPAQTKEQAVLLHLIDDSAPKGFWDIRDDKSFGDSHFSVTVPVGASECLVRWEDSSILSCFMLKDGSQAEAKRVFDKTLALVARVIPDWKQRSDAADSVVFMEPHPAGTPARRGVLVHKGPFASSKGDYVFLEIVSPVSGDEAKRTKEKFLRDEAQAVAEDTREFIAAAVQHFDSFKQGTPTIGADGSKTWAVNRRPFFAESCKVIQTLLTTYACFMLSSAYEGEVHLQFDRVLNEIQAALPAGWSRTSSPPFDDPSAMYFAPGYEGQIWVSHPANTDKYQLSFQITNRTP